MSFSLYGLQTAQLSPAMEQSLGQLEQGCSAALPLFPKRLLKNDISTPLFPDLR